MAKKKQKEKPNPRAAQMKQAKTDLANATTAKLLREWLQKYHGLE